MYRYSQIPTLTNIQFIPEPFILPERYHYYPIDKNWFCENIRDWQLPRPYMQPIQQTDKHYFEVHAVNLFPFGGAVDSEFQIVDRDGVAVTAFAFGDYNITDANSIYRTDDGTELAMTVSKFNFRFSDYTLNDGIYRVVVRLRFYSDLIGTLAETRYWVSEPCHVKENHPDTVYIQAWSNTNKDGVIFKYDGAPQSGVNFYTPKFGYRFFGDIDYSPQTTRDAINFIEQDGQTRQLSVEGQPVAKVYVGGNHGVPFYQRNKLNEALKCDNVLSEGRRKTVVDGAEWEVIDEVNALSAGFIELTDYDARDWYTDTNGAVIELFEIPGYPFYIVQIDLQIAGTITYGRYITNDATRDAYLLHLQTEVTDLLDQLGDYAIQDGKFVYINGANENDQLLTALVQTTKFQLTVVTGAVLQNFKFYFDLALGGIVWGDGSYENMIAFFGDGSATANSVTHTYAAAGTYTVSIFHNDTVMRKFNIWGTQFTGQVTGQISGDVPSILKECNIIQNPVLGTAHSFNMDFLARCSLSLISINLSGNGLTAIGDTVFASNPYTFLQPNWLLLTLYSLTGNALTVSEINTVISDFYVNTPKTTPGVFAIKQLPPATPTGTALTQANNLVSIYGWFVARD